MSQKKVQLDKAFLLRALLIALAVFLAAHAFCYFNLSLRGSSLMLNAEKTNGSSVTKGQYLLPFYWRLRGGISSPFFIGLLSFIYLFAAELILSRLLSIRKAVPFAILSCILFICPALLELNVGSLFTADATCLAFLLMTAGSACLLAPGSVPISAWQRMLLGFILLCGGFGLEPTLSNVFFCIAATVFLSRCLTPGNDQESASSPVRGLGLAIAVYFAALLASLAAMLLFCRRAGMDPEMHLCPADGKSFLTSLILPVTSLFAPVTIYPRLLPVFRIIMIAFALPALLRRPRAIFCLLLLIPAMVFPIIGTETQQFPFQLIFLDIALLLLVMQPLPLAGRSRQVVRIVLRVTFTMFFLGSLVFANHAYLKVNLDFDTSLAIITQVISRLEDREDFSPAATQVAFLGSLADSPLVTAREGFEHLSVLRVLDGNTSLTDPTQMTWYFWETLGYPMNCLSGYDQEQIAALPEAALIPVFPAPESIRRIGDTLVVRLSE
ncbi:MAG: hypothetical protein IJT77_04970 [Clostridia bacterium]|nr:hypothetical protein [Clostridia bacterium]